MANLSLPAVLITLKEFLVVGHGPGRRVGLRPPFNSDPANVRLAQSTKCPGNE
jgi:hypothetical protein